MTVALFLTKQPTAVHTPSPGASPRAASHLSLRALLLAFLAPWRLERLPLRPISRRKDGKELLSERLGECLWRHED